MEQWASRTVSRDSQAAHPKFSFAVESNKGIASWLGMCQSASVSAANRPREQDLSAIKPVRIRRENGELCHRFNIESRQKRRPPHSPRSGLAKKPKTVYLSSPHYCHVLEDNRAWQGEGRKE